MSEFKGTKGKWMQYDKSMEIKRIVVKKRGELVDIAQIDVFMNNLSNKENNFNLKLIKDAGNVRQKINFDLPELLRQRNEMLEMIQTLINGFKLGLLDWEGIEGAEKLIKETTEL